MSFIENTIFSRVPRAIYNLGVFIDPTNPCLTLPPPFPDVSLQHLALSINIFLINFLSGLSVVLFRAHFTFTSHKEANILSCISVSRELPSRQVSRQFDIFCADYFLT